MPPPVCRLSEFWSTSKIKVKYREIHALPINSLLVVHTYNNESIFFCPHNLTIPIKYTLYSLLYTYHIPVLAHWLDKKLKSCQLTVNTRVNSHILSRYLPMRVSICIILIRIRKQSAQVWTYCGPAVIFSVGSKPPRGTKKYFIFSRLFSGIKSKYGIYLVCIHILVLNFLFGKFATCHKI